ncbi:DNA mismatch repair protein MutL [Suhomyces tanzawaensis NRRL Y-17324]|uniref:DNA mismatch repair protein MutL n=1 Tax=Suhomyces tanzawaensis NRRL Y-17324 TaxID=984487 RepID=A0A1E4SE10_9ASCO|nr:DNA mismatch repair protein MutL [Suhomyces tanzawaensis NRRL Y-17324]ODV77747.1 DNA mismatch repair protein MutL [Suhomyces tanzawaensis NRRL Y-17324]
MGAIHKLDAAVINKIAAGEIIIQPANALKEMLENSIDAEASMIDVVVKDGGLKLLQITDNGSGINKEDLGLLCERFATSKLAKFEDLESIATYGFRGEALASILHISRVSVITKTKDTQLAYKAFYTGGKMVGPNFKALAPVEPKPIAGKDGTQIIVEDLFYNLPSRAKSLKSKSEEYSKIVDVIGRYAIHSAGVGITCKKFGDSNHVIATRPNLPIKERIRSIFGTDVASELIEFDVEANEALGLVKANGAITSPNYGSKKKAQPVFFINHRLVTCDPLKRAINSAYQIFLPKGNHPFVYLSLEINPKNVDVNIHPTKREVRFLHEEEIIEHISGAIHTKLSDVDTSRKFKTQTLLGYAEKKKNDDYELMTGLKKARQENKLVRVDPLQIKISSYLSQQSKGNYISQVNKELRSETSSVIEDKSIEEDDVPHEVINNEETIEHIENKLESEPGSPDESQITITDHPRVKVNLDSIKELQKELSDEVHKPLTNIFNNAVYVGVVDEKRRLCCFQYDVQLYLCDYASTLLEFYYQVALEEFCNYGTIELSEPVLLDELMEPLQSMDVQPRQVVYEKLESMLDMLQEYFHITIKRHATGLKLHTLPMLHKHIRPVLSKLPYFIYRLAIRVNYDEEKACLHDVMRQIALLYLPEPIESELPPSSSSQPVRESSAGSKKAHLEDLLEHVLFPLMKQRFLATKALLNDVIQIADLPGLYKVFERC